jgi:syndecan 1
VCVSALCTGIICGAVMGLLCAMLLVMFIVYRMKKKDEGSYSLDEPQKKSPTHGGGYTRANDKEFFA